MEKKENENPPTVLSIPFELVLNKYDANVKQHLDKGKVLLVKKNKVEPNRELKFKWINSKGISVLDATKIKSKTIPARLKKVLLSAI